MSNTNDGCLRQPEMHYYEGWYVFYTYKHIIQDIHLLYGYYIPQEYTTYNTVSPGLNPTKVSCTYCSTGLSFSGFTDPVACVHLYSIFELPLSK